MERTAALFEPWLAPFLEGAGAELRVAAVLEAAARLGDAPSIAVWSAHRGPWREIAGIGNRRELPSPSEVRAATRGELTFELAAGKAVLVGGERWALALGGRPVDSSASLDLLEAFLMTIAAIEEGASLAEFQLPVSPAHGPSSRAGTHAPEQPPSPSELRELLREIRDVEALLALPHLSALERAALHRRRERACERAGDLLMGGEAAAPPDARKSG